MPFISHHSRKQRMQQQQPIGILLISTGQYKQFVKSLVESLDKHFLKTRKLVIYLFTDDRLCFFDYDRINFVQTFIPSYKFPLASLYRYKIFAAKSEYYTSHLFYFDVDMKVVADIGEEFLGDIVAVRHPGFDKVGGGSWETRPQSGCFTTNRKSYYAGGVQGGETDTYYKAMQQMSALINTDEHNGILPIWHDESVWNYYLSKLESFHELDSSYCMVEQMDLRKKWKIDHLEPKIIALEKNHQKIRE